MTMDPRIPTIDNAVDGARRGLSNQADIACGTKREAKRGVLRGSWREGWVSSILLLRGAIVNRTYGGHENLYI